MHLTSPGGQHPSLLSSQVVLTEASLLQSIYQQDWWLDAAADGHWRLLKAGPRGNFTANMPIFLKSLVGLRIVSHPPLTRTLGPIFINTHSDECQPPPHILYALSRELIDQIPPAIAFSQVFDPACKDLLAFQLAGFDIAVKYTFRLPAGSDRERIWGSLRDKARNAIRRSQEKYQVEFSTDVASFVGFYASNLKRTGRRMDPSQPRLLKVLGAAVAHDAGTSFRCVDENGRIVAAIFLVWDQAYCHYLLSTRDETYADNGAISLLLWKAITWACQRNLGFDFDGYPTSGAAQFLRHFGAHPVPRWKVTRMNPVLATLRRLAKGGQSFGFSLSP